MLSADSDADDDLSDKTGRGATSALEEYGAAAITLELISSTALFLAREPFRVALARSRAPAEARRGGEGGEGVGERREREETQQQEEQQQRRCFVNTAWLSAPVGLAFAGVVQLAYPWVIRNDAFYGVEENRRVRCVVLVDVRAVGRGRGDRGSVAAVVLVLVACLALSPHMEVSITWTTESYRNLPQPTPTYYRCQKLPQPTVANSTGSIASYCHVVAAACGDAWCFLLPGKWSMTTCSTATQSFPRESRCSPPTNRLPSVLCEEKNNNIMHVWLLSFRLLIVNPGRFADVHGRRDGADVRTTGSYIPVPASR